MGPYHNTVPIIWGTQSGTRFLPATHIHMAWPGIPAEAPELLKLIPVEALVALPVWKAGTKRLGRRFGEGTGSSWGLLKARRLAVGILRSYEKRSHNLGPLCLLNGIRTQKRAASFYFSWLNDVESLQDHVISRVAYMLWTFIRSPFGLYPLDFAMRRCQKCKGTWIRLRVCICICMCTCICVCRTSLPVSLSLSLRERS